MCKSKSFFLKSLLVVLAASVLIACGGKEERKAKYLERGKAYFEEQNFDKARVEFKNVLQIDPKTAEPYYYLGEIEEKQQNWAKAFGSYKKASELDPALVVARIKLARFYLAQASALRARQDSEGEANAMGLAQEQIAEVISRDPANLEGLALEATLWAAEGEFDRAAQQLEKVLQKSPGLRSAAVLLTSIYDEKGRREEAEGVLLRALSSTASPSDRLELQKRLSQFYLGHADNEKAETVLRTLVDENPDELAYRVSLASFLSRTKRLDQAEEVLREAIAANPQDAQRYLLLTEFLATQRDKETAIAELEGFVQQHRDLTDLQFGLVKMLLADAREEEAVSVLEGLVDQQGLEPDGLKARVMLAEMLASEDADSPRIGTLLDEVLQANPRDNAALLMKGKLDARKGNYTEAIANFRSVIKDQPDSAEVLQLLAFAHLANGERELARDTMSRAIEANPGNNDLRLSMVQLLVEDNKSDEAMEQIEEVLKRDQYQERALAMKYELLAREGDEAGMEEVAKLMQAGAPEKEEGYIREARLRLAQSDFDAALAIVDRLLDKNPESMSALVTKSDVLVAQKKYDKAIEVAGKLIDVQPDSPEGYYRKARLLQEQGDIDASLKFYDIAIEKAPQSELVLEELTKLGISTGRAEESKIRLQRLIEADANHPLANGFVGLIYANEKDFANAEKAFLRQIELAPEKVESYSRLAQARLAQEDLEGAAAALDAGLQVMPDNPQLIIGLAGVRERQDDFDAAISLYERVLMQQPDNAISINNLAALLSDHRSDDASLDKAAELAEKLEKTNQPAFLDTAGWVYYRQGNYDKALPILERVVEEAPQVPVFRYHLGMAYFQKGDKAAAKQHLTLATDGDYSYEGVEEARATLESL